MQVNQIGNHIGIDAGIACDRGQASQPILLKENLVKLGDRLL
ncbi:hypothetical protein [Scytonema sp. NUACC26]